MTLSQAQSLLAVHDSTRVRRSSWSPEMFLEESDGAGAGWFKVDADADVYLPLSSSDLQADDYVHAAWPTILLPLAA